MNKNKIVDSELLATADDLKKTYQPNTAAIGPGFFRPGHKRFGGRAKGSQNKRTRHAIEICDAMNFHPAAFLATIALTGLMPNPDGSTTPVSTDDRLKAATALAPFVMPKLQATQLSGNPDAPIAIDDGFDINLLLADPSAVELAQALALKMSGCQEPIRLAPQLPEGKQE